MHAGAIYEAFAFSFNLGHVSNGVALWLGMRPADIFVYVFLPPFLLDLAVRLDFFMLKKVCARGGGERGVFFFLLKEVHVRGRGGGGSSSSC